MKGVPISASDTFTLCLFPSQSCLFTWFMCCQSPFLFVHGLEAPIGLSACQSVATHLTSIRPPPLPKKTPRIPLGGTSRAHKALGQAHLSLRTELCGPDPVVWNPVNGPFKRPDNDPESVGGGRRGQGYGGGPPFNESLSEGGVQEKGPSPEKRKERRGWGGGGVGGFKKVQNPSRTTPHSATYPEQCSESQTQPH